MPFHTHLSLMVIGLVLATKHKKKHKPKLIVTKLFLKFNKSNRDTGQDTSFTYLLGAPGPS